MAEKKYRFIEGKVSVVTPVYNGEFHLARMLDSVLSQTYEKIDMILVDDGSTDGTLKVADSYREKFAKRGYDFQVVEASHRCASGAINQGLPYVDGEYLIWPDSDDYLEPESVAKRVSFLQSHPQYECVRSLSYYFNAETGELMERADEKTGDLSKEDLFWDILESKTFVCCGCYMLRAKSFFEIYPKRHIPEYNVGQNFQMLLPFMYRHKCPTIQERLYGVYVREGSHSRRKLTEEEELRKYRNYEHLADDIARICRIKDKDSKKHILQWKARRRRQIAMKYSRKFLVVSALYLLYKCGDLEFYQMISESADLLYKWGKSILWEIQQQILTYEINRVHFCKKKVVALTFDATWGNTYTTLILQKLKQYKVKATFFISGIWIERYPEDFRLIFEGGHEIGNHSYKHPHMLELSTKDIIQEIVLTQRLSEKIITNNSKLFRFPFGERNSRLVRLVKEKGFLSINWSIDSFDWKGISAEEIYTNVIKKKKIESGEIILMHNGGEHTAEALDLIIPALKEMGYEVVDVSSLLKMVWLYKYKLKRLKLNI